MAFLTYMVSASQNIYVFSVLRTLEIVTNIRIPDYRPAYSCLSAPLIGNIRCLLAVTSVSYG